MELNLLDSFGKVDEKVAILSNEEYAFIVGSQVMVRQFKTLHERNYKFLKADSNHFCAIEFNSASSLLAVCECGINSTLKIYNYSKEKGFDLLTRTSISKALEVSNLSFSYDGTRLAVLIPEPLQILIIYELVDKKTLKEIITIPLEDQFTKCKISSANKNFICLMNSKKICMLELKDSFNDNYDTQMGMEGTDPKNFIDIKNIEEEQLKKRSILNYKESENEEEFVDFVWDSYNNIYMGTDMGMIYVFDVSLNKIVINFQNEPKDNLRLNAAVTSLLLTQRFLIASTDDCKISMINIYIPENDIAQYKPSIGNPENYRMLEVEKEFSVLDGETITFMKYDQKYSKLLVGTEANAFYLILLPAEILISTKEKDEMSENNNIISPDIDHFEECKFHTDKIIGLRELGNSSQFITVGADRNIIIWELSDRNVKSLYNLDYFPTSFEVDAEGDLLFTGSKEGVFRVYDITNRSSIRLIHQIKFSDESIDKIVFGYNPVPNGNPLPFLTLFKKGSNTIFFTSAEAKNTFNFLGYINAPYPILDITYNSGNTNHAEILVLIKQMILSYEIPKFHYDHKIATEIKEKKEKDIFLNFELHYELKARKCDSDLRTIFKQGKTEFIWLTGTDYFLRIYNLPNESFELLRENKRSPENPVEEMRGHDLEITNGICNDIILITGGLDGKIQIRKDRVIHRQFRSHSCLKNGVSAVYYSQNRKLFYSCGFDGSIFLFSESDSFDIPSEPVNNNTQNDAIEVFDTLEELDDNEVKKFRELIIEEHNRLIKLSKKTNQAVLKTKLDEIRVELNKYLRENNDLEEIEKLSLNEMIIDLNRIEKEKERGEVECDKMTKIYFEELCELEILKEKLFDKTYNSMVLVEENQGQTKITNNNIRMTSSTNGEKILKSYPIRNFTSAENARINYVKQLRLIEINEKYKRKSENTKEILDEIQFSYLNEDYILNRIPSKITLIETEIKPSEIMDSHEGDYAAREKDGGRQYKIAKYKLQREPYENENLKNMKNDGDNLDQANFKPDEQLLKEDLSIKYKTVLSKPIDVEFTKDLADIDSFNLLYSPFELYTSFRKRNQIYLIIDIIQGLKHTFNKEFKQFLIDKNVLLEKFNTNKVAIENIREVLGDVHIENYTYAINPHEDNEWIKKVEEGEIKIPKYFSKEEKKRLEEEKRIEEERLKALQGDTLEMRGLTHMIEQKSTKTKKVNVEEQELVKEPFMEKKKKEEWTEDEIRRHNEYQKKEKEILERKEKIRSQNLTKLNNHKMDIENIKSDLDSKFLKIFKKKLYYDYKITEQELCILALLRSMDYRSEVKAKAQSVYEKCENLKDIEELFRRNKEQFETNYNRLVEKKKELEDKYVFFNKAPAKVLENLEKSLLNDGDLTNNENEMFAKIRNDPMYFVEKERFKYMKRYGNKGYKEIKNNTKSNDENLNLINRRHYYQYKLDQFNVQRNYLTNEFNTQRMLKEECERELDRLKEELRKSKLNFDILIKIKKGQDEITDDKGPQEHVDECVLIDHTNIEEKNKLINTVYSTQVQSLSKVNDHKEIESYMNLDYEKINLEKHEIELKLRYLKLTRVTKKIQEVVTGREDIDHAQLASIYDQKKKNLEENKKKRELIMDKKIYELRSENDKKKKENLEFSIKLKKLMENVNLKEQIIMLDSEDKDSEEVQDAGDVNNKNNKKKYKNFLEIARVTKLKNLVQQYYEEIEYLRTELDKLRARTFPSFLQKPDQVLYPDEK